MTQAAHLARIAALAIFIGGTSVSPMRVLAKDGPWLVRLRTSYLEPANKDSSGIGLHINSKYMPEIDVTYFLTPNMAMELVVTVLQKHTISIGDREIGSFKYHPPTLTLQHHWTGMGAFKPYVGAGINLTRITSLRLPTVYAARFGESLSNDSRGFVLQAGADYALTKHLSLNVDVKKVQIRTDVDSFGTRAGSFRIDPWLVGVGVGWRF